MPESCEIVEVRNVADADGFPCSRTASKQCFDCGSELCESHTETCGICNGVFCPSCLSFHSVQHPQSCISRPWGTSGTKKGLKLAKLSCGCSGLFPIREGHKLIQNFLQSLKPPFLVGGCPASLLCICVRFASLISAISSRSFLMRSDTSLGINTAYSSEGRLDRWQERIHR